MSGMPIGVDLYQRHTVNFDLPEYHGVGKIYQGNHSDLIHSRLDAKSDWEQQTPAGLRGTFPQYFSDEKNEDGAEHRDVLSEARDALYTPQFNPGESGDFIMVNGPNTRDHISAFKSNDDSVEKSSVPLRLLSEAHPNLSARSDSGLGRSFSPQPDEISERNRSHGIPSRPHNPVNDQSWEKIKNLRKMIWILRTRLRESRRLLHEKRLEKSEADDAFSQFLNKWRLQGVLPEDSKSFWITFDALSSTRDQLRDAYGPMEDDHSQLEGELSIQEFALEKLETELYERPLPINRIGAPGFSDDNSSTDSLSEMSEEVYHPLVEEYLSKMGDVNIIRERLDWNLDEKENLEEEKVLRQRVNLDLAPPDQEWLDNYNSVEEELLAELKDEENQLEMLRLKCVSLGLLENEIVPISFEAREQQILNTDFSRGYQASGFVEYPILIPPPIGIQTSLWDLEAEQPDPPITESTNDSTKSRVDLWLLHQLRMSSLQVRLLATTFENEVGAIEDEDDWQANVLQHWFHDGTPEEPKQAPTNVTAIRQTGQRPVVTARSAPVSQISLDVRRKSSSVPSIYSRSTTHIRRPDVYGSSRPSSPEPLSIRSVKRPQFDDFLLHRWFQPRRRSSRDLEA